VYAHGTSADSYRGLCVGHEEVDRLLCRGPGAPVLQGDENVTPQLLGEFIDSNSRLAWLAKAFGLSSLDVNVVVVALAPELDLRYERLYAYLQDDVTRKRPMVDLALNLFSPSAEAKLALRSRFSSNAPLVRHKLLHLIPDPGQVQPPLLSHYLKLDDQVVGFVLGDDSLDQRLSGFCRIVEAPLSAAAPVPDVAANRILPILASQARNACQPLRLYFRGVAADSKMRAAQTVAQAVGSRLLVADMAQVPESAGAFHEALLLAFRQSWLQSAVLYIEGLDVLRREERSACYRALLDLVAQDTGILILSGTQPWIPGLGGAAGVLTLRFDALERDDAIECWRNHLERSGVSLDASNFTLLAERFRLTPEQIADAVACAVNDVRWRAAAEAAAGGSSSSANEINLDHLCATARAQCGHE